MTTGVEISFLKEPVSQDELAIAVILQSYALALKEHDTVKLLSLYDKEAQIDSYAAHGTVSLEEFAKEIPRTMPSIVRVSFKALVIKFISDAEATVSGVTRYDYPHRLGTWHGREWEMIKKGSRWYIIRSKYNDFRPKKS